LLKYYFKCITRIYFFRYIYEKKVFSFFEPVVRVWLQSFAKNVLIRHNKITFQKFNMGTNNAEFDSNFEPVEKVAEKLISKY